MATIRSVIGDAPKRREDLRFITGNGRYLDDLPFEDLAHAVVLRSPYAHALIERILTEKAHRSQGVERRSGLLPHRGVLSFRLETVRTQQQLSQFVTCGLPRRR